MRTIAMTAALAAAALVGGFSAASAQVGFGAYVGPGYYDNDPYYYGYAEPAPPVRYYSAPRYDDDYVAEAPRQRGGCGTYFYWNGERCVDARRKRSGY